MAVDLDTDIEPQDLAEVFDEDTTNTESQRLGGAEDGEQAEDLVDLFDVTKAVGDADDEDALIGDDLDDDEIVELAREHGDDEDDEDETDEDTLRGPDPDDEDDADLVSSLSEADDDLVDGVDRPPPNDVNLTFVGDLNDVAGAHSAAQRYESKSLSDDDLAALDYQEDRS
jgi:hypothetical protein